MRLRDRVAGQALAPVIVVTLAAGEVELALAAEEGRAAGVDKPPRSGVAGDGDGQAAGLPRDVGGEREQVPAFEFEGRSLLSPGAAKVDALLQVQRSAARGIERRVARRDALHARARIAVAIGAGAIRGARLPRPQRLAVEHPKHARIGRVVVLHCARVAAHELVAGAALGERNLGGAGHGPGIAETGKDTRRGCQCETRARAEAHAHSMRIEAVSVTE